MSEIRDKVVKDLHTILDDWVDSKYGQNNALNRILSIPELAIVDRGADIASAISFNLGCLQAEIGNLYENYPANFNLIMGRLRKVLGEAGYVKEVKAEGEHPSLNDSGLEKR